MLVNHISLCPVCRQYHTAMSHSCQCSRRNELDLSVWMANMSDISRIYICSASKESGDYWRHPLITSVAFTIFQPVGRNKISACNPSAHLGESWYSRLGRFIPYAYFCAELTGPYAYASRFHMLSQLFETKLVGIVLEISTICKPAKPRRDRGISRWDRFINALFYLLFGLFSASRETQPRPRRFVCP